MTLLRLSPDGERLRRIAKAHAAGELSTPDYRRIRGDVIDSFAPQPDDLTGDDTQQRWSVDTVSATPVGGDAKRDTAATAPLWPRVAAMVLAAVLLLMLFASESP